MIVRLDVNGKNFTLPKHESTTNPSKSYFRVRYIAYTTYQMKEVAMFLIPQEKKQKVGSYQRAVVSKSKQEISTTDLMIKKAVKYLTILMCVSAEV